MARNYYTVVVRETRHDPWEVHFGDYDRAVADQERLDVLENDSNGYAKVIVTSDRQVDISSAVKSLNRSKS